MKTPSQRTWGGRPSGPVLAELLRRQAAAAGTDVVVDVTAQSMEGSYLVTVSWGPADGDGMLFEVADWVHGVRLLDPDGEDVTVDEALRYFSLRAGSGCTPKEALGAARPIRPSWRERRRRARQFRTVAAYGSCPNCQHDWREHPGGIFEASEEICGECRYELDHGYPLIVQSGCRTRAPAPPSHGEGQW